MLLLLDGGNLAIRCLFSSRETISDFRLFRYIYFQTIFANIKRYQPMEVVLALDGRGYWRRKVWEDYKKPRKKGRDESPVDFDKFFEVLNELNDDMKTHLPFKILQLPMVEADDILSVIARKTDEDKILVSSDRDFVQLLACKNLRLWNPIKKEWITSEDPRKDLLVKILTGDGDEAPPIKKGVGPKTAHKIVNKGFDEIQRWVIHEGLQKEFKRNDHLVNLFRIPAPIESEILKRYQNYELPEPQIVEFFHKYNFRWFIDRMDMAEGILLGLYGG